MTDRKTIRVYIQGYAGVGKTTLAALLLKTFSTLFKDTKVMDPEGDTAIKLLWLHEGKLDPEKVFREVNLEIREVHAQAPLVGVPGEPMFTLAQITEAYNRVDFPNEGEGHLPRFLKALETPKKKG